MFRIFRHKVPKGFDKVKDLVRGTIIEPVDQLWDAYQTFKNIDKVKVISMKQKLDSL